LDLGTDYLVQLQQIIDSEIAIQTLHRKAWIAWYDWLLVSGSVQQYLETNASALPDKPCMIVGFVNFIAIFKLQLS
jgi:hypothetical protein